MPRFEVDTSTTAYFDVFTIEHQYDTHGWHRLHTYRTRKNGNDNPARWGVWTSYAGIATITFDNVTLGATTDYFNSELPEIFVIHKLKEHDHLVIPEEKPKLILKRREDNGQG